MLIISSEHPQRFNCPVVDRNGFISLSLSLSLSTVCYAKNHKHVRYYYILIIFHNPPRESSSQSAIHLAIYCIVIHFLCILIKIDASNRRMWHISSIHTAYTTHAKRIVYTLAFLCLFCFIVFDSFFLYILPSTKSNKSLRFK